MFKARPVPAVEPVNFVLSKLGEQKEKQILTPALEENYRLCFKRFIFSCMDDLDLELEDESLQLVFHGQKASAAPKQLLSAQLKTNCHELALSFLQKKKTQVSDKAMIALTSNLRYVLRLLKERGFTDYDADGLPTPRRDDSGKEVVTRLSLVEAMLEACFENEKVRISRRHSIRRYIEFIEQQNNFRSNVLDEHQAYQALIQDGPSALPSIRKTRTGFLLQNAQGASKIFLGSLRDKDERKQLSYCLRKLYTWCIEQGYLESLPQSLEPKKAFGKGPKPSAPALRSLGVGGSSAVAFNKVSAKEAPKPKSKAKGNASATKTSRNKVRPQRRLLDLRVKNLADILALRDNAATSLIRNEKLSFNQIAFLRFAHYFASEGYLEVQADVAHFIRSPLKKVKLCTDSKAALAHYKAAVRPTPLGAIWGAGNPLAPLFLGSDGGNLTGDDSRDAETFEEAYYVVRSNFVTALVRETSLTLGQVSELLRSDLAHAFNELLIKRGKPSKIPLSPSLRSLARAYIQTAKIVGIGNSWTGEENRTPLLLSADRESLLVS